MLYPLSYGGAELQKSPYQRASLTLTAMTRITQQSSQAPRWFARAAVRVLVVDDDEVIRQLITLNLELEGFEVQEAVDGEDALRAALALCDPAVITLDIMMPNLDGWDAAARLQQQPGDRSHQGRPAFGPSPGGGCATWCPDRR